MQVYIKGTFPQLVVWIVLNMWPSHFGLPLLIGTVLLSKNVQRHAVFVSMCVIWMIAGLSSSILVYSGHITGPEPPTFLCLLQASLLYGVPPSTALATLILVYQMFVSLRKGLQKDGEIKGSHPARLWFLLSAPYAVLLATAIATAAVGATNPASISRNRRFFYCSVESNALTNTIVLFSATNVLATLVLQVWTLKLIYTRISYLKQKGANAKDPIDITFTVRTLVFGFYLLLDLCLSFISIGSPTSAIPDLTFATTATAVCLLFGTQPDMIRVWCGCCRRDRRKSSVKS